MKRQEISALDRWRVGLSGCDRGQGRYRVGHHVTQLCNVGYCCLGGIDHWSPFGRVGVVAVAVPLADLAVPVLDDVLGALPLCGLAACLLSFLLRLVRPTHPVRPCAAVGPAVAVTDGEDLWLLAHRLLPSRLLALPARRETTYL